MSLPIALNRGVKTDLPGSPSTWCLGLDCCVVSDLAWDTLRNEVNASAGITDDIAANGVRALHSVRAPLVSCKLFLETPVVARPWAWQASCTCSCSTLKVSPIPKQPIKSSVRVTNLPMVASPCTLLTVNFKFKLQLTPFTTCAVALIFQYFKCFHKNISFYFMRWGPLRLTLHA